jgi:hypothetical protein
MVILLGLFVRNRNEVREGRVMGDERWMRRGGGAETLEKLAIRMARCCLFSVICVGF